MRFIITPEDKAALCRQAPEFAALAGQADVQSFDCHDDLFYALVQSIVWQQLSFEAASAIFARLEKFLGVISAESLLEASSADLRACGLSARKIEYLRGIATARLDGSIDFASLPQKSEQEIIDELTRLKGVGSWTVEMLLIFALGRRDVLSFKDLGIRKGIMLLHRLDSLNEDEFEVYRKRYSPYGTLASLLLWQIKDGGIKKSTPGERNSQERTTFLKKGSSGNSMG
jgi:DNA-3-methyladenine glycosylase II